MPLTPRRHAFSLARLPAAALLTLLTACGGGGGGSSGGDGSETLGLALPIVLNGTVATGAALVGATVSVTAAGGATVCETTVAADGQYRCTLPAGAAAPFVLVARRDDTQLVSVQAEGRSGQVNITPITHLVAAGLASNGNPLQLVQDLAQSASAVTPARVEASVVAVQAALKPAADAVGDHSHPISGPFAADGTGHDRLLDALQISVRPAGEAANVEITVKVQPGTEGAAPVSVSFSTAQGALPALPANVASATLPASGSATQIAQWLARTQACYALPLAERSAGSEVVAAACRSLFIDNEPNHYLNNGRRVGPQGDFSGLFSTSGTGLRLDRPRLEHLTPAGDLVVTARWTTLAGTTDFGLYTLRPVDGQLKLVGNQLMYSAQVHPKSRTQTMLHARQFDYQAVGYAFVVSNVLDNNRQPLFTKVVASHPLGRTVELRPLAGATYMGIVRADGGVSTTTDLWFAGRFLDPAASGRPSDLGTQLGLYTSEPTSEDDLRALPDHMAWRFEFFHADPDRANVVQYARTLSRAPTLGEARQLVQAQLAPATLDALAAAGDTRLGSIYFRTAPTAEQPHWLTLGSSDAAPGWTVPTGAIAPTYVAAYGYSASNVFFQDSLNPTSATRWTTLVCSQLTPADTHCDADQPSSFGQNTRITSMELIARAQNELRLSTGYGFWIPVAPAN